MMADGSFMLPVPRSTAPSVFISHGTTARAEEDLDVGDRLRQHLAAAAESFEQHRPECQHADA